MSNISMIEEDLLGMNVSWLSEDMKLYDQQSGLVVTVILTTTRFLTLVMAVIVHRAFYKLLKRLPDRPINQIIYPYMVNIYISND